MAESHSAPARVRPGIVTISSYLLILVAAIQVINLILTLATIGETRRVLEDAYRDSSVNGMDAVADFAVAAAIGASLITLLLAVGLVVLALLNNRGRNGARITTWVVGGILFCCTGGGLLSGVAGSFSGPVGGSNADMPSQEEVQRQLQDALPSWYTPVSTLLGVVAVLALLAALTLLALPASNAFFRKPQPAWEPPVPGAYPGYPPTPGYPPPGTPGAPYGQPGHPPAYGQPGYPGTPGSSSSSYPSYPSPSNEPGTPSGDPYRPESGSSAGPSDPGPSSSGWSDSGSSSSGSSGSGSSGSGSSSGSSDSGSSSSNN